MLYNFSFTIPKKTTKQNPAKKDIVIRAGVIETVKVIIPFGHMGKAGMQIRIGEVPVMPVGEEFWIYGNNEEVEDKWYWEIDKDKEIFTLVGYNESEYNDHTFIVRFIVVPPELVPPELMPRKITQVIKELKEQK